MSDGKTVCVDGFDSLFAVEVGYAMLELLPFCFKFYSLCYHD